jgi:hypothetical protein
MPTPGAFPSALTRRNGGDPGETPKRTGPTPKQIAMMDAETYKRYMQSRGDWQEADKESISKLSNPATFDRRNL